MKKLLTLLLAAILILSLAACAETKYDKAKSGEDVPDSGQDKSDDSSEQSEALRSVLSADLAALAAREPEAAEAEDEGYLIPVMHDDGYWGYLNIYGKWKIWPYYKKTTAFSGSYASYVDVYSGYNIIDRSGKKYLTGYSGRQINEAPYYYDDMMLLTLASETDQNCIYINSKMKMTFTADNLPLVSGRSYDDTSKYAVASPFNDGYAAVMRLRNSDIDDEAGPESAYIIDHSGSVITVLPEGLDIDRFGIDDNGLIIVKNTEGLYGICNTQGKIVVACSYRSIRFCEGDYYLVCDNVTGFWGYIDKTGKALTECIFSRALPFSEGLAAVCNGSKWGFIDETGQLVLDYVFDDVAGSKIIYLDVGNYKGAFACEVAAVSLNDYWLIIDKEENVLVCMSADDCPDGSCPYVYIYNDYIVYKKNTADGVRYGVLDCDGREVIPAQHYELGIIN